MEHLPKLCEICDENERIYKCPKCGTSTCSLKCCLEHKKNTGCDGKRDKTAFVPVSKFNETHMKSDYHFLEDVLQTRQSAKRTFEVDCGGEQRGSQHNNHPYKRQKVSAIEARAVLPVQPLKNYNNSAKVLVKQAKDRGTTILLQPQGMSKRRENSSRFDKVNKCIIWQLTVVFVLKDNFSMTNLLSYDAALRKVDNTQCESVGFHVKDVQETMLISNLIQNILVNLPPGSLLSHLLRSFKTENNLNVLIRKMPSPANNPLFSKMNLTESLRECLHGHQIIEFPTLYICKATSVPFFRLMIDSSHDEPAHIVEAIDDHPPTDFEKHPDRTTTAVKDAQIDNDIDNKNETLDSEPNFTSNSLEISLEKTMDFAKVDGGDFVEQKDTSKQGNEDEILDEDFEGIEEEVNNDPSTVDQDADGDEEYEEFMKNLVDLQSKDIKTLQSIIQSVDN